MKKYRILILILLITIIVFIVIDKKNAPTKNPVPRQDIIQNYNPPKEIKYDTNTNLQNELDSVNPEVLESDFESI